MEFSKTSFLQELDDLEHFVNFIFNVWFKFTVVHTPLGDPRGFTSTLIDTGNFHLKIQCEISRRSGFQQKKRKKVKSPEGGMYDGKFEPHINKKNLRNVLNRPIPAKMMFLKIPFLQVILGF